VSPLALFSDELEQLVARAAPAVIAVTHRKGNGTGLVFTHDGYALTNAHVVQGQGRVEVRFHDGEEVPAEVVGLDAPTDLAVLRTGKANASTLPLSDGVRVGQVVVAMGHPFGFERSVTLGVVSAVERALPGREGRALSGLIQTDAAINPGNSGGPLLDVRGQMVGVNTAMLPWAQGIGFAVPSSTASWVASLLLKYGEVRRRYLGIAARNEALKAPLAETVGQAKAIRVLEISRGSPAASGGLETDDLVLQVNGHAVATVEELQRQMALELSPQVELTIWHKGGKAQRLVHPAVRAVA